jgi:nucleotide-binding universal stress UspA family protein
LAGASKGEIRLLHVIELIPGLSRDEEKPFYDRLERKARAHLGRYGKVLADRGIAWHAEVRVGTRAPEITRRAAEDGADLIVLTAPRLDPNDPATKWGSRSYLVGILAQCPVLLVK